MQPKLVDCLKLVFKAKGKPDYFLPLVLLNYSDETLVLSNGKRLPWFEWKFDVKLFKKCFFTEEEWNDTLNAHSFSERAKDYYSLGDASYPVDKLLKKLGRSRNHVIVDFDERVIVKSGFYTGYVIDDQSELHRVFELVSDPDEISHLSFFFGREGIPDYIMKLASKPYYFLQELTEEWYVAYHPGYSNPCGTTLLEGGAYQMAYEEQALDFAMNCDFLNNKGYRIIKKEGIAKQNVIGELERIFKGPYIK